MKLAILGAGAIGCYVGGLWSQATSPVGGQVSLIGRAATLDPLRSAPLHLSGRPDVTIPQNQMSLSDAPSSMAEADVIVLALKSHGLPAAMDEIARHTRKDAVILSLLNGIAPVRQLRERFADREVIAGMVPFNVVWRGPTHLHRSGAGQIAVERHGVTQWQCDQGTELTLHDSLDAVQHGKLLLNLVNPVNALAGIPLSRTLSQRGYRKVYAAALAEALAVYEAGQVDWTQVGPTNPALASKILRLPDWLFRAIVLRRQGLDPHTMTSMAHDVQAGRPTEIDAINAEITRLGDLHEVPTPVNGRLVALIKEVESGARKPGLTARDLVREVLG